MPVQISSLEQGDKITGFALLTRKERRQDRNGKDFLDLQLSDATGSISGKVWADSPALDGDYEAYDFVAYKGSVSDFKGQLQIKLQECRRAAEADREFGFDEADLIPTTPENLDDLERRLRTVLDTVERPALKRLSEVALERHGKELREHPAAKTIHHAYRGGLLEHVVSMLEVADKLCGHYADIDRDLVLLGVLFHDLGKIREIGAMPRNEYSQEGRLVGHVVIGRDLLLDSAREVPEIEEDLRLHLEHLVLSHQGRLEYGAPVQPLTAEALVVHFIDDLDSKINQFRSLDKGGTDPQYLRGIGRYVFPMSAASSEQGESSGDSAESAEQAEKSPEEPEVPQQTLEL